MTVLIFMLFACLSFNCLKCVCISDPAREFFAWLETALSPNCVPPNVELTPDAIRNGEVLLTNVSHTASITYPRFPTRSIHRHWLACNTSQTYLGIIIIYYVMLYIYDYFSEEKINLCLKYSWCIYFFLYVSVLSVEMQIYIGLNTLMSRL